MYVESRPGEMSFAEQQKRGLGPNGMGTITASQLGAITSRQLGADPAAPAGAPAPLMVAPPVVMQPVSHNSETMAYVVTAALGLGLAFVLYKVMKD